MEGEGFLARFADGPASEVAGIKNLAGTSGDFEFRREQFGWPLPDRLCVIASIEVNGQKGLAVWDEAHPEKSQIPESFHTHPDKVTYVKVMESQLPEDVPGVMRGAEYKLEESR